jgi:hypothetical protein
VAHVSRVTGDVPERAISFVRFQLR